MRKKKIFFFFSIFLVLLLILLVIHYSSLINVLVLSNVYSGKKYFLNIVSNDTIISIEFFHSYDKDYVVEVFKVENNMFKPIEVIYSSDTYDYRELRYNGTLVIKNDKIILHVKDNVMFKSIIYQIAYLAPQKLTVIVNGKSYEYYLQWFGERGEAVKLEVVKIPYIILIIHGGYEL